MGTFQMHLLQRKPEAWIFSATDGHVRSPTTLDITLLLTTIVY